MLYNVSVDVCDFSSALCTAGASTCSTCGAGTFNGLPGYLKLYSISERILSLENIRPLLVEIMSMNEYETPKCTFTL